MRMRRAGCANVAEEVPGADGLDAELHALLRDTHEFLCFRRSLADDVHARGIRVVAVEDRRDVDIQDIALLEDRLLRRDAVTDDLVDRDADVLRIALVVEAGRDTAALADVVSRSLVERCRIDARADEFRHEVECAVIDDASGAHAGNVLLVVDDLLRRAHLAAEDVEFHLRDALIKVFVTFLVLLAAATPA